MDLIPYLSLQILKAPTLQSNFLHLDVGSLFLIPPPIFTLICNYVRVYKLDINIINLLFDFTIFILAFTESKDILPVIKNKLQCIIMLVLEAQVLVLPLACQILYHIVKNFCVVLQLCNNYTFEPQKGSMIKRVLFIIFGNTQQNYMKKDLLNLICFLLNK